ncbi:MAG: hypothetical protein ACJA1C_002234 [Crocinitomicaceae bacterium]|jgi:hypothetical protein
MTYIFKTLVFLCLSFSAFSQNNLNGTYQLMTSNPKAQEVFSSELLILIENERLNNSVAIVKIGDFTWVRILSLATISDPNFTPLSDEIIFIDPNDVTIRTTISNESNN